MSIFDDAFHAWGHVQTMIGRYGEHVDWLNKRFGTQYGPEGILYLCEAIIEALIKERQDAD